MEADRMTNLTLSKENVEIEKQVILEERFQRIESDPSSKLDESMRSILFPNHYYGRPIIGWRHEIEGHLGETSEQASRRQQEDCLDCQRSSQEWYTRARAHNTHTHAHTHSLSLILSQESTRRLPSPSRATKLSRTSTTPWVPFAVPWRPRPSMRRSTRRPWTFTRLSMNSPMFPPR